MIKDNMNNLATAQIFQKQLDEIITQDALTGWMDANAGQVVYNGGDEVKIPTLTVQGLGDYDRGNGYQRGSVTVKYQTHKLTQDRGRMFQLDPMDIDESNFIPTAAAVMGEFQRSYVVPEIDAYRISTIAQKVRKANKEKMIGSYNVEDASTIKSHKIIDKKVQANESGKNNEESTIIKELKNSPLRQVKIGIKAIRENGYNTPLVMHATPDFLLELEFELSGKIMTTTFSNGGIDTQVPSVDGVPIISTPSNRMYTEITMESGKPSNDVDPKLTPGGYSKVQNAKVINFIIMPLTTPIAITKLDTMRIFDPSINQKLNAWQLDYRRFHDVWVLDNKVDSIYVNMEADKKSTTP